MELTLNLIWGALSIAMFVAFVRGSRRRPVAATVAMCLAAIAFPIISITDDLCNDVLFADALSMRRTSHRAQLRPFSVAVALTSAEVLLSKVTCCGTVAAVPPIAPPARILSATALRGPPLRVR